MSFTLQPNMFGSPRFRRSRGRRAGARSRGGRGDIRACRSLPCRAGTRSRRRRCGRTYQAARSRPSVVGASPPRTLVRGRRARHPHARRWNCNDCGRDRDNEPVRRQRRCGRDAGSSEVAEPARLARAPEEKCCAPDEQDADRAGRTRSVLAARADCRASATASAVFERQRTEHGCERGAASCGKPRVDGGRDRKHGERRRAA